MDSDLREVIDFRRIAESSHDWENWFDAKGKIVWINSGIENVVGYRPEECLDVPGFPATLADPRDRAVLDGLLEDARSGGRGRSRRLRLVRKDACIVWVAVDWSGVPRSDGTLLGVRLTIRELGEDWGSGPPDLYHSALSRLARAGLHAHGSLDQAFQAVTETASHILEVARVGIWLLGEDRQRIICRDVYESVSGLHSSGMTVERPLYPGYFAALEQDRVIAAHRAQDDPRTRELCTNYLIPLDIQSMMDVPIVRDGETVGVLCHEHIGQPRLWHPVEINFASSLADMIATALESAAHRELLALHRRLASIIEASPDLVGMADTDGHITYLNPAGRSLLGLASGSAVEGLTVGQINPAWNPAGGEYSFDRDLKDGVWRGETDFVTVQGERIPAEQVALAHDDDEGRAHFVSTVARDLRPWKQTQAALAERERFLATLLGNLPGVAYRRRNVPDWPLEYISDGCLELTGYSATALMAGRPHFNELVHPADRPAVDAEVAAAMTERRTFNVEYRICRADGSESWVWARGRGIHDADGRLLAREGFIGDINDRVLAQRELERLNAELEARVAERTAKLSEANQHLEAFAYSVSHDLKAPLRGIDGYSRLLLEDYRDSLPEEAQRFLDNVRSAADRMNQLIDDLLAYSKLERRDMSKTEVSLSKVLALVLAERQIELTESGAVITADLHDHCVQADFEALLLALRNVIDNALKFSRDASPPRIELQASPGEAAVILRVSDNGCGFDMKYHDRIFEVFQRLHRVEQYPGTGVGLAIVRKAIERMGGRVWAQSAPGSGAHFYMELPR